MSDATCRATRCTAVVISAVGLLSVVHMLAAAEPAPDFEGLIRTAKEQNAVGLFEDAIATLDGVKKAPPKIETEFHCLRAQANSALGNVDAAQRDYANLIQLIEPHESAMAPRFRLVLGNAYRNAGKLDLAIKQLDAAISKDDQDVTPRALIERCKCFQAAKPPRLDAAIKDCDAAIGLVPDSIGFYLLRGNLLTQKGAYKQGHQDHLAAVRIMQQGPELSSLATDVTNVVTRLQQLKGNFAPLVKSLQSAAEELTRFTRPPDRSFAEFPATLLIADEKSGTRFTFVFVPPGNYRIGYLPEQRLEACREARDPGFGYNASISHAVELKAGFFILDREITVGQWASICGNSRPVASASDTSSQPQTIEAAPLPVAAPDPDTPCNNITWTDSALFCRLFTERFGIISRLPSEVEWECAARPSKNWVYPWGPGTAEFHAHAQQADSALPRKSPLGNKDATPSGIYDLAGNLSEWCADEYQNMLYGRESGTIAWDPYALPLPQLVASQSPPDQQVDPPAASESTRKIERTCRGGAYPDRRYACQTPARRSRFEGDHLPTLGFRPVLLLNLATIASASGASTPGAKQSPPSDP